MSKTLLRAPKSKKHNRILKIGIDIDNTIADSYTAYLPVYNRKLKKNIKYHEIDDFYLIGRKYQISLEQIQSIFWEKFNDDSFQLSLKPYPESLTIIKKWLKKGYHLHYITGRPHTHSKITERWLKENGFWSDKTTLDMIHLSRFGQDPDFKKEIIDKYGVDIIIEDHLGVVNNAFIPALLINRPWNLGEIASNVTRVKDWMEIDRFISSFQLSVSGYQ